MCAVKYIRSLDALMACTLPPPPVDETLQMLPDACTNTLHRAARKIYQKSEGSQFYFPDVKCVCVLVGCHELLWGDSEASER